MTDAPRRIWISEVSDSNESVRWGDWDNQKRGLSDEVQYIRADIADEMETALSNLVIAMAVGLDLDVYLKDARNAIAKAKGENT